MNEHDLTQYGVGYEEFPGWFDADEFPGWFDAEEFPGWFDA